MGRWRALHPLSERSGPLLTLRAANPTTDPEAQLFGEAPRWQGMLTKAGATVVIENAEMLSGSVQRRLADWLEQDMMVHVGTSRHPAAPEPVARVVLVCQTGGTGLAPALAQCLRAGRIEIPPLRERPEDVPALARHRLAIQGGDQQISADGYRLLLAHSWPGNIPELRAVIDRAALHCDDRTIGSAALAAAIGLGSSSDAAHEDQGIQPLSERDWLLDALRRNRFRRGDTAAYLGISRKTLYNKMRRMGLLE